MDAANFTDFFALGAGWTSWFCIIGLDCFKFEDFSSGTNDSSDVISSLSSALNKSKSSSKSDRFFCSLACRLFWLCELFWNGLWFCFFLCLSKFLCCSTCLFIAVWRLKDYEQDYFAKYSAFFCFFCFLSILLLSFLSKIPLPPGGLPWDATLFTSIKNNTINLYW